MQVLQPPGVLGNFGQLVGAVVAVEVEGDQAAQPREGA